MPLLSNIHKGLQKPGDDIAMVTGDYYYYHYGCDGFDDRGWGCGYRTLQTLCSWIRLTRDKKGESNDVVVEVPSLRAIQECLVKIGDKPRQFLGSRDWIGSFEVAMCLDELYQVPCKLLHISSGDNLREHVQEIKNHFKTKGSPIMMGGDSDASSKGILGICGDENNEHHLLILDPHYHIKDGEDSTSAKQLQADNWISWRPLSTFLTNSFYNLCLPQLSANS
ncbi:unnamed protein product [Owenia fusiformis]|uniref:UFSP1/2/DUB catalytic domain-containing protein n=1 Tax=Owenia fusiformis TaxID=6347 RepID=A0A8J1XIS1_OWEFU|nr:unnamed protein product [Owenia fusiformis]